MFHFKFCQSYHNFDSVISKERSVGPMRTGAVQYALKIYVHESQRERVQILKHIRRFRCLSDQLTLFSFTNCLY